MKKTIQLNERDITHMVMEAVNELDWKTYANAAKKRKEQGHDNYKLDDYATRRFNDEYGYDDRTNDNFGWVYSGSHNPHHYNGQHYPLSILNYHHGMDPWRGTAEYDGSTLHQFDNTVDNRFYRSVDPIKDENGKEVNIPQHIQQVRDRGDNELMDYLSGNYEYKPYKDGGKGWTKKNESIVREAVNRTLRKYLR